VRVVASVCTVMSPEPDDNETVGGRMLPAVAVILPDPPAFNVIEVTPTRSAPNVIEPFDPDDVFNVASCVLTNPVVLMLPFAVKLNELPVEAPRETLPLSVNVTSPVVFAVSVPALV
jgi:hypothetical protein